MRVRAAQPASFLFVSIGIIFLILFGVVSLGVYTENNLFNSIDLTIIEVIQSNVTDTKTIFLLGLTEIGNIRLVIILTIGLVIFLFTKKWYVAGLWFGGTILFCAAFGTKVIKKVIDRTRPDILPLIEKTTESFPSGHAASATIFYGLLGFSLILLTRTLWKRIVIGFLTSLLIGFILMSRIYLGVHFPSDVIAGFLYGLAVIFISIGVYQFAHRQLQKVLKQLCITDQSVLFFKQRTREKTTI